MPDEFFKDRKYIVEIDDAMSTIQANTIEENREMDVEPNIINTPPNEENNNTQGVIKDRIYYHPSYNSLQFVAHMAAVGAENHSRQMSALTVNNILNGATPPSSEIKEDLKTKPSKHRDVQSNLTVELQLANNYGQHKK